MMLNTWLASFWATDAPVLPALALMQWALPLGWGVVCSWLVWQVMMWPALHKLLPRRMAKTLASVTQAPLAAQRLAWVMWALVTALMFLPAGASPAYWLGLAFQQPSLACVAVCGWGLVSRSLGKGFGSTGTAESRRAWLIAARCCVVAGWALLLDTFAVLPMQLYAFGFSPAAVLLLAIVAALPWLWGQASKAPALTYGLPTVVLAYTLLRLPTGNAWDALLDPWLWLAAHVAVLRWGRVPT